MATAERFEKFVLDVEPALRRALTAAFGHEEGHDATAEALAWAWEHSDRALQLAQPVAYLYRVGRSSRRRRHRISADAFLPTHSPSEPWVEPGLASALAQLTSRQRVAVVMIHGFGWTFAETAELLNISLSTVQKHCERGLAKIRHELGVPNG